MAMARMHSEVFTKQFIPNGTNIRSHIAGFMFRRFSEIAIAISLLKQVPSHTQITILVEFATVKSVVGDKKIFIRPRNTLQK